MKRVRGGSGLGDSLYLRPFVAHWLAAGEEVEVCSNYPDVFLGSEAKVSPFRRDNVNKVCHYVCGKQNRDTNQWQDLCISAQVTIPLAFKWEVRNTALVRDLQGMAKGRPIVLIHGGREPMNRTDKFARALLPTKEAFDLVLQSMKDCFTVEVGKGNELYPLAADIDLTDKTSVSDLMDIAWSCDGAVGQCSWVIPLCEAFDKPLLCVWASEGLKSSTEYVRLITPRKILSKPSSRYVMDDWTADKITEAANAFRQLF